MLRWIAADLVTGQVLEDLPSLDPQYPVRHTLSAYDSTTATLNLDGAPAEWERATLPGASLLACYDDTVFPDGTQPKPIPWVGYVSTRVRDQTNSVTLGLTTLEGYLDRRYVGDVTYQTTQDRAAIAADFITSHILGQGGITSLHLDIPTSSAYPTQTLVWQNADNVTVYGRLTQLLALIGGEFTIDWAWGNGGTMIVPTLHVVSRVGLAAVAGQPQVTFEMPGTLSAVQLAEDYTDGAGANSVSGYSSASDGTVQYQTQVASNLANRPLFEYRYSPATNVSPAAVAGYVTQAAGVLFPGKQSVTLTSDTTRFGHTVGRDWNLGDDIGYRVAAGYSSDATTDSILSFPVGFTGIGRAVAYDLTPTTVAPILAEATVYQQPSTT